MARIELRARDGTGLTGRLDAPHQPHGGVAVLCHPHPRLGGSMDSWMMPVLARALRTGGWLALRFNFRAAAGASPGADGGEALDDLAGAIERGLEELGGQGPVLLGGWSFGARVSLCHGPGDARVAGWFGVGLPLEPHDSDAPELDRGALARWEVPKLFVHGDRDAVSDLAAVRALVDESAEPKRLRVIAGGDHFLAEHGDVLSAEVGGFAATLAPEPGPDEAA